MARGNENSKSNLTVVFGSIKMNEDNPRIELIDNYGKEDETLSSEREIGGHLVNIIDKSWDSEQYGHIKTYQLILEDEEAGEVYFLSVKMDSAVGRDIANSLIGTNNLGWVSIAVGKNKAGYNSTWISNNKERTSWNWHPTKDEAWTGLVETFEVKKKINGKITDAVERDFSKLNDMLMGELMGGVKDRLSRPEKKSSNAGLTAPVQNNDPVREPNKTEDADTDDIPF